MRARLDFGLGTESKLESIGGVGWRERSAGTLANCDSANAYVGGKLSERRFLHLSPRPMLAALTIWAALFGLPVFGRQQTEGPRTARDYYNELYSAGGLDNMADEYVCFRDDSVPNFFIFVRGKDFLESLQERVIANPSVAAKKLLSDARQQFKNDPLIIRDYVKGIPSDHQSFFDKQGSSWVSGLKTLDKKRNLKIQVRLTIDWQTLRYRWSVEVTDPNSSFPQVADSFGRCEMVSDKISQRGYSN